MPNLRSVATVAVSAVADALPPVYHIALGKGGGGGGGGGGKGGRSSGTKTSSSKSSWSSSFFFGGDGELNWYETLLALVILVVAFVIGIYLYIQIRRCRANYRTRREQKMAAAQALEPKKDRLAIRLAAVDHTARAARVGRVIIDRRL